MWILCSNQGTCPGPEMALWVQMSSNPRWECVTHIHLHCLGDCLTQFKLIKYKSCLKPSIAFHFFCSNQIAKELEPNFHGIFTESMRLCQHIWIKFICYQLSILDFRGWPIIANSIFRVHKCGTHLNTLRSDQKVAILCAAFWKEMFLMKHFCCLLKFHWDMYPWV